MVIQLPFQGALHDHFRQLAQQPALTGQLQPARASPLGKLVQQLLIGCGQLRRLVVLAGRHVSHWCLLCLWSYTVEITVPRGIPRYPDGLVFPSFVRQVGEGFLIAWWAGPVRAGVRTPGWRRLRLIV